MPLFQNHLNLMPFGIRYASCNTGIQKVATAFSVATIHINRYKTMNLDPSLFDLTSDSAIEALMEDAINDNLTREQTDYLDEYLNSTTDF